MLAGTVRDELETVEKTIDAAGADGDTRVPPGERGASREETVDEYLRATERDLRPIWPRLAERLRTAQQDL